MESLIVCRCAHTIDMHENGGCVVAACSCRLGSTAVLNDEIDRFKSEYTSRTRTVIAAGRG